ncbi:MAG TPA: nicotinate phosphoribosyltransferase [Gaiellaceae bacterium]|nr:nicotinate phosphoribosyltransferase [Gaiellaceae bacterium]
MASSPSRPLRASAPASSPLLVDLYELTMGQAYLAEGLAEVPATFGLFFRKLPRGWGYLLAAGLDDVLTLLERFAFAEHDLAYLEETGLFTGELLDRLRGLRFTGEVRALPEGTPFFPQEPVLEVTAPVLEAQLVETLVLNQIHYQTLVASKAARSVEAARGRKLVDFGLRRTPGAEAGLKIARASYLAGFDATSNVLAGREYGIEVAGTMAHSFVQCFEDETESFRAFARSYPGAVLLVDTYDTVEGTRRAIAVARELAADGHRLRGVRLDSGDLEKLSRRVRRLLDSAGFADATIFASGGIDEYELDRLLSAGAPIDGFGVGTKMAVAADAPYLDMAYKLVAFDGKPRLKLSEGKATLPGAKQAWRSAGFDELDLAGERHDGEPLLIKAMEDGRRLWHEPLAASRERAHRARLALPRDLRALDAGAYELRLGPALAALRDRLTSGARTAAAVP